MSATAVMEPVTGSHGGTGGDAGSTSGSSSRPVSGRRRLFSVLTALVFTVVWAVVCTAAIDRIQAANEAGRALSRPIQVTSEVFGISALVVWVVLVALVALTGRVVLSAGLLLVLSVGVGLADYQKLEMRSEPVYPSDLQFMSQPGFLVSMVGVRPLLAVGVALLGAIAVFLLVSRLLRSVFPRIRRTAEPRTWVAWMAARVAILVVAALLLGYAAHFNDPGNKLKQAYVTADVHWVNWNQRINYMRNGFVAGLLYNTQAAAMREPGDYSKQTMDELAAKWTGIAEQMNQGRSATALDDVNVVVILSESFSDPTQVPGIHLDEDPIPFTHRLMKRTESGQMLSEFVGGGTANMEFEALTGFSLAEFLPQLNTPYQQLVAHSSTFPSVVGYLRHHGHDAVAIHPYAPMMYNRQKAYPTLGFSHFVHDTMLQQQDRIERNHYISDASAFNEVEYQIEKSDKPLFVNLVTMQNHYPVTNKYDHPIGVTGDTRGLTGQLDQFARGLRYSDSAMRDFLKRLAASPEKTAVVFYGDHAPPLWPRAAIYHRSQATLRKTPFFLWSNFQKLPHHQLPLTSPTHFMPLLFDALGAPLPPYYALLDRLYREIPAISPGELHDPTGEVVDQDQLSPEALDLLHDYRLVQYDLTTGKRYSQSSMFYPDAG